MHTIVKRLTGSQAARNAAASYFSFFSVSLWGLLSIPIAVAYLDKEQLGLWAVVNVVLSYLIWLDLGVGTATGRLIAKPVADRDQSEINRWWSATRAVLYAQAVLVVVIGLALVPAIVSLISPSDAYKRDTVEIMVGGVLLTAVFFPIRGIPGLLTAQQRFHWVPLIAGLAPWANLLVFYVLLKAGWGLRAYIAALAASQMATMFAYMWVLKCGPDRPQWDRSGITRMRFSALFGYSSKLTVVSIVEAVVKSLPTMIIARAGGLALVPVYDFASKVPMMGYSLASRTYQSFYPALLRLHVKEQHSAFETRFRILGRLTLGIGTAGAAVLLVTNKSLVTFLAGPEFFPGAATNVWFAVSLVTYPLTGLFVMLIILSGELAKIAWIYLAKIVLAVVLGYFAWTVSGMVGIAALFTGLPLVGAVYGYTHGGRLCGTSTMQLTCRRMSGLAGFCAGLVIVSGYLSAAYAGNELPIQLLGRETVIPSFVEMGFASVPLAAGLWLSITALSSLFRMKPAHST